MGSPITTIFRTESEPVARRASFASGWAKKASAGVAR